MEFVEGGVVNFKEKGFKIFSEIVVIFFFGYGEECFNCFVTARRNIGWCGPISGIIARKIAIFRTHRYLAHIGCG